jgi:hypothetical protein
LDEALSAALWHPSHLQQYTKSRQYSSVKNVLVNWFTTDLFDIEVRLQDPLGSIVKI